MSIIVLTSNTAFSLFQFRKNLIQHLMTKHHRVICVANRDDSVDALKQLGAEFIEIKIDNRGLNPLHDIKTFVQYLKIYHSLKPDLILQYTIKPVIYSALASRWLNIKSISMVTGLGSAFLMSIFLKKFVSALYRVTQKKVKKILFLNQDDQQFFIEQKIVPKEQTDILPGEGIDVHYYSAIPLPENKLITFLFIGRLLTHKGLLELITAAKKITSLYSETRFQILGPFNFDHPASIKQSDLEDPAIHYLGEASDVRSYIQQAHCIVLPSYREGLSRALLEAAAMGRPIIASNIAGCKEIVDEGKTGFLCKVKDSDDLIEKIKLFLALSPEEKQKMGDTARKKVVAEFSDDIILERYEKIIASI